MIQNQIHTRISLLSTNNGIIDGKFDGIMLYQM